jgi:undecaprenyl-diphosphatase
MKLATNADAKADQRPTNRVELSLLAGSIGFFVCVGLGFAVVGGFTSRTIHLLDERIIRLWRELGPPDWLVGSAINLTALGSAIVLGILSFVLSGYLALHGRWRSASLVLVVFGGAYALNSGLKATFDRARPDASLHLTQVHSPSFPSGHAAASAAVYLGLATGLARQTQRRREKFYFFAIALSLVVSIGLTRVFLGVHYPSDVLVGWTIGALWAAVPWVVYRLASPWLQKPK